MEKTDAAVAGGVDAGKKWIKEQLATLRLELLKKHDAVRGEVQAVAASQPALAGGLEKANRAIARVQAVSDGVSVFCDRLKAILAALAAILGIGGVAKVAHASGKKTAETEGANPDELSQADK